MTDLLVCLGIIAAVLAIIVGVEFCRAWREVREAEREQEATGDWRG